MSERIKTKHGEITLEELAGVQPGMARLMDEVSRRWHYMYYAAKGGNWELAMHELKETMKILEIASKVRPKYTDDLKEFTSQHLNQLRDSIERREWKRFDELVHQAVHASNNYHEKYGKGFIRYVLPKTPPEHLDLGPKQE